MLWRFQCPHFYWAKLCIKDLIEQYFEINAAMGFCPEPFTPFVAWFYFCPVNIAQARQHFWVVLII